MPAEAAVQSEPLVVTDPGQTVTDDFDVKDCSNQAVLEIGSTADAGTDNVTTVNSNTISGTFSKLPVSTWKGWTVVMILKVRTNR